jgi:hypothetical protein
MTSADLCRKNGWTVGTVLEADEGNGPERIVITAVGEESVLAKAFCLHQHESNWNLTFRDWKEVSE